jgi:ATP-dependent DNA helicase UvrD/PcrA
MRPANAQDYTPGDIVALSFDDPEAEALYITQNIKALHGVAIKDEQDPGKMRGISLGASNPRPAVTSISRSPTSTS